MAQTSIGFNGSINAAAWAANAPLLLDGADAIGAPGECVLSQVAGQRQVSMSSGRIGGDGVVTVFSSAEVMTVPTPTNGQWFLLVLNRVWSTGSTSLLWRNGPTTGASAYTLPPETYPASMKSNPGTDADVPVAWAWASSSTTVVNIFPILLPTRASYPRAGSASVRSTVLSPYFPTVAGGAAVYAGWWAQQTYPLWLNTDVGEYQQYIGQYQASLNPAGKATAGWTVVGNQSTPLRYDTEAGAKSGSNALAAYGEGGLAYARDTDGLYYRRGDGVRRIDSDTFVIVEFTGAMGGNGAPFATMGPGTLRRYSTSDSSVFPVRSDGVVGPIVVDGWYFVSGNVTWESNGTNQRNLRIMQNDDDLLPPIGDRRLAVGETAASLGGYMSLSAGDFVKLKGSQDSGTTLTYNGRLVVRLVRPNNPS